MLPSGMYLHASTLKTVHTNMHANLCHETNYSSFVRYSLVSFAFGYFHPFNWFHDALMFCIQWFLTLLSGPSILELELLQW